MKIALVLFAAVSTVSAHATWQEFWVGTEDQAGKCVRTVQDNSPIVSVTDPTMACGRGPKASTGVCTVAGTYLWKPSIRRMMNPFQSAQLPC